MRYRYPDVLSQWSARIAVGKILFWGGGTLGLWESPTTRRRKVELPGNESAWVSTGQACWARDGEHLAVLRILQDGLAWGGRCVQLHTPGEELTCLVKL